jgi:fucose permease
MVHNSEHKSFIFYTLCLIYIAIGMVSMLPGAALLLLATHTTVSLDIVGWVLTSSSVGYTTGVFIAGQLGKRFNPKYLLMASTVLIAITAPIMPWTHSFWILLLAQFIAGTGFGVVDVSINQAIALTFTEKLGEMLNKLHSAFGIGALTGPMLLSIALSTLHEASWAFITGALVAALAFVLLSFLYLPMPEKRGQFSTQAASGNGRTIFTQWALWLLAFQLFLYVGGEVSFGGWITSALSQAATITLADAAPAATLYWLGLTLGRLLGGQILKKALLRERILLYLCFLGAGLSGFVAAIFIGNIWIAFTASLCIGTFCGPIFPGIMAIASRRFADTLSSASSILFAGSGMSGFFFPPLVGIVLTHVSISWSLLIPALLLLLIAIPFALVTSQK